MRPSTLFSDFLTALGVRHTSDYADAQFAQMPFDSLFGLTKLLQSYGIESEGYVIADKSELTKLTPPFLADTPDGFVIVTAITPSGVTYMTQGESEQASLEQFCDGWNGTVLLAFPTNTSIEPDYELHRRDEIIATCKKYVMWGALALLFGYLFVTGGLYKHVSTVLIALIDIAGLVLTYMLVQKSLKIKNRAADRVCGVLQEGGCDKILETSASKFFGIFSWSEVGFTYFSVSLLCLLMFPQWIGCLALCNALCLPFTVWSIWYQKFRARHWCTLCVSVQASLWLLFFCYCFGGWLKEAFPLRIEFFVLGVTYLAVVLLLNRLMPLFDKKSPDDDNSSTNTAS